MRRLCPALVAVLLWGGAACRGIEAPEVRVDGTAECPSGAAFPGAVAVLQGFDLPAEDGPWCAGDEVLFGLRLRRGQQVQHWLLHLRLTEPLAIARAADATPSGDTLPGLAWSIHINGAPQTFESRRCRVLATVMDADGHVLGRTEPLLPRDFLRTGFTRACELVQARFAEQPQTKGNDAFYTGLDVRPFAEATVSTVALLQVVQADDVLAPLLWEVVQRPSVWSVLGHLGAKVVMRPRFHAATEAPSPLRQAGPRVVWRVPMTLLVNDAPALTVDFLVGRSEPPYALCGGVLGAVARHPTRSDVEFSMVLLAARRGGRRAGAAADRP